MKKNSLKPSPWGELERNQVGIRPLNTFLGKLLYDHIREEFPTLVEEIAAKLCGEQSRAGRVRTRAADATDRAEDLPNEDCESI